MIRLEREDGIEIVLIGNKADLSLARQVTEDEAKEKAKELDAFYIETSAKTGFNITTMFRALATILVRKRRTSGQPNSLLYDHSSLEMQMAQNEPVHSNITLTEELPSDETLKSSCKC